MEINLYQLFGVGALAHRGLPPSRSGVCAGSATGFPRTAYSAREGCPGHCGTLFYETDFQQISVPFMPKQIWFSALRKLLCFREQGSHPSEAVHMFKVICSFSPPFGFTLACHTLGCKCVYSF